MGRHQRPSMGAAEAALCGALLRVLCGRSRPALKVFAMVDRMRSAAETPRDQTTRLTWRPPLRSSPYSSRVNTTRTSGSIVPKGECTGRLKAP